MSKGRGDRIHSAVTYRLYDTALPSAMNSLRVLPADNLLPVLTLQDIVLPLALIKCSLSSGLRMHDTSQVTCLLNNVFAAAAGCHG